MTMVSVVPVVLQLLDLTLLQAELLVAKLLQHKKSSPSSSKMLAHRRSRLLRKFALSTQALV